MRWKQIFYSVLLGSMALAPFNAQSMTRAEEIDIGRTEYSLLKQEEGGVDVIHSELSQYVRHVGKRLAAVSDRPDLPYEFVILDNQDVNAWALPGGKIGINLGMLLKLSSEAELASVLAHEIGHAAAGHSGKQIEREDVLDMLGAGIHELLKAYWYNPLIDQGATMGEDLILLKYSREDELEADGLGIKYMSRAGYDTQAAIDVEAMLLHTYNDTAQSWLTGLLATHPPSKERLKANKKTASFYPSGGIKGAKEYERAIGSLRTKERAYCALEKGRNYLRKGSYNKALSSARRGLSTEPKEPHLYLLKARAEVHLRQWSSALTSINRALAINPDYYLYYLERSLIYERLGNARAARYDKERAKKLYPPLSVKT